MERATNESNPRPIPTGKGCRACGYDLSGVAAGEDGLRCPECGRLTPSRVPKLSCPLDCRHCGADLAGAAVTGGKVVCPSCGKEEKWPEEVAVGEEAWTAGAARLAIVFFLIVAFGIGPAAVVWVVVRALMK